VHLSVLAEMLDKDLPASLAIMREHRLPFVDLKQHVYGARIHELDNQVRHRLRDDLDRYGIRLSCLASTLGHRNVLATSEQDFRMAMEQGVTNLLDTAAIVRPRMIRLLACTAISASGEHYPVETMDRLAPWVIPAYQEAIRHIAAHGISVTIENEPDSVLSSPDNVLAFFARLEGEDDTGFTWDIQNMWQSGTVPSLSVYEQLRSVINYVHLKGGRNAGENDPALRYRCGLESASWPVIDLVGRVIDDGTSPVICLNTSHGEIPAGDPFIDLDPDIPRSRIEALHDAAYIRQHFKEFS
jgi:hypothetical protein